jgi:predicted porin
MKKLIVILAVIAMVGAFTATAMADVELYGSARFRTYYTDTDPGTGVESDSDLNGGWVPCPVLALILKATK